MFLGIVQVFVDKAVIKSKDGFVSRYFATALSHCNTSETPHVLCFVLLEMVF